MLSLNSFIFCQKDIGELTNFFWQTRQQQFRLSWSSQGSNAFCTTTISREKTFFCFLLFAPDFSRHIELFSWKLRLCIRTRQVFKLPWKNRVNLTRFFGDRGFVSKPKIHTAQSPPLHSATCHWLNFSLCFERPAFHPTISDWISPKTSWKRQQRKINIQVTMVVEFML